MCYCNTLDTEQDKECSSVLYGEIMVNDETSHGHMSHFGVSLLAGGLSGLSVDVSLYPIDTIKTRLQSQQGFFKAGGFRGIYKGLPSVPVGSIPGAALFFCTYEAVKARCSQSSWPIWTPVVHMAAACSGEVVACTVRVPVEVVKQRTQTYQYSSAGQAFVGTLKTEGIRGFYRGYWSTIWREIPFSFIQFPLWEFLKSFWSSRQGHQVHPWQSATCGAIAGGFAAALTTPFDVAKTRIILAKTNSAMAEGNIGHAITSVYMESGLRGLFAGALPRTVWISLGGAIFLGIYDKCHVVLR